MNPDQMPALKSYKTTPTFTQDSVPVGLLADHSTKEGVWGLIHVSRGKLRYCVTDPRRENEERILEPGNAAGVVEPTIVHRVELLGPVEFRVEFLRAPSDQDTAKTLNKGAEA